MATNFPALKPASRSFSAAQFPVTVYKAQSGVTQRRLWASKAGNATLKLTFNNLNDTDTNSILTAYSAARGSFDSLVLPSALFDGMNATLKDTVTGTGLTWRFADDGAPTVETTFKGRSRVDVVLVGTI